MLFSTKHRQSLMDQAEEPDLYGFSLSFCLDTTASSAQVQKNEKIKSLIILLFTPLLKHDQSSDLCELLLGALISIRYTLSE